MRVLSVSHGPTVGGDVFDDTAEQDDHALDCWVVPDGASAPAPEGYDAIMVFGGGMHPDQDEEHGWLPGEAAFLRLALERRVPLLGVCLGAQLLARAAGAWVGPARGSEVGWCPVELTAAGRDDPVLGVLPERFSAFQWHHYTYEVPAGGVELATSTVATQAYRLEERAWGVQFHPEVSFATVAAWIEEDPDDLPAGADALVAETRERIATWNEQGRRLCRAFLAAAAATSP